MKKKMLGIVICIILIFTSILPVAGIFIASGTRITPDVITSIFNKDVNTQVEGTEYWGLLVAAGEYLDHPEYDVPYLLEEVENMYNMLLVSEHWTKDHIRLITGKNATAFNIIKGLRWLDEVDDEDDMCLVYISTHGGSGPDLPPFDEKDRHDEYLETYRSIKYSLPFMKIWDDELNYFLSLLDSKGICVIIDSCHSGGFNDTSYKNSLINYKLDESAYGEITSTSSQWIHGFAEDIESDGRVILMSSREDESSLATIFTMFLIYGLQGFADINGDDICSAEEVFEFARNWTINATGGYHHPTIYDGYPGEFPLTEVELPPSRPQTPVGPVTGKTNTTYLYSTSSTDPEGDRIQYFIDWDDGTSEWSSLYPSGETVNLFHSWYREGTYTVMVRAKDELGAENRDWSNGIVVTMTDRSILDQRQTEIFGGKDVGKSLWLAQSFKPSLENLSKVEVGFYVYYLPWESDYSIDMAIKRDLHEADIAEISLVVEPKDTISWVAFDFPDIPVVPGETYYIVCKRYEGLYGCVWLFGRNDPYPNGSSYYSVDHGKNWHEIHENNPDFCFVTYG